MIKLNSISKIYDDGMELLKDFSMSFEDNKITCIFGPSGVGKTTIAGIAAKIVPVDSGTITGTENTVYSYVFQEPRLLPWYSVYENIDFVLKDVYNDSDRDSIINNYIEMVDLSEYKDYKPRALSGGMAQRVSLARAFAYPSNVLIMDEPFKGLDIKLKQEMISLFERLWNKNKKTVIFITHDIEEAVTLSHIIYIISGHPVKIEEKIDKSFFPDESAIEKLLLSY